MPRRVVGSCGDGRVVYRRIDVEFLPVAPCRAVRRPYPQMIGARAGLERRRLELLGAHVDGVADALIDAVDDEMPARGIQSRIPELVCGYDVAIGIADAQQVGH